jgi:hypothetical protein
MTIGAETSCAAGFIRTALEFQFQDRGERIMLLGRLRRLARAVNYSASIRRGRMPKVRRSRRAIAARERRQRA